MPLTPLPRFISVLLLLLYLAVPIFPPTPETILMPVTGGDSEGIEEEINAPVQVPSLDMFTRQVWNGDPGIVTGLFIDSKLALQVIQQPSQDPTFVSGQANAATQFSIAEQFDSLGFLAHNYLAGAQFFYIRGSDIIHVIRGNGHIDRYQVKEIRRLQALQPRDPYSDFKDLQTGTLLNVTELFSQTYAMHDQVILQTCIASEGEEAWGRLFIIAIPYTAEINYLQKFSSYLIH